MSGATSKWAIVEDMLICVTGPGIIGDPRFQIFLQDLRRENVRKYLGATLGRPESTSVQRKQTTEIMKAKDIRTAIITDDPITLGVVTAMSWFGVNVKAFSWRESRASLGYLQVEGVLIERALETLDRLRCEVEVASP